MCNRIEHRIQEIKHLFELGIEQHSPSTAKMLQKELNDLLEHHVNNNDYMKHIEDELINLKLK